MNNLGLSKLLPEGILLGTILLTLILDLIRKNKKQIWLISISGIIVSLLSIFRTPIGFSFGTSFEGTYFNLGFRLIILFSTLLCIVFSTDYIQQTSAKLNEYVSILLTATLGSLLLTGANDLVTIFVALETLGLSSYLMTAYMTNDLKSNEAAIKYLVIGAVSTSFFLYGLSWLYGLSGGEIELHRISASLEAMDLTNSWGIFISLIFITIGVGFKISAFPFHQWTPDVYEGAPVPVTAFLSVVSKSAGVALLIRLFTTIFSLQSETWTYGLQIMAIGSMVIGNVVALSQTSIKRMLGYSSIAQIGFILIGILANNPSGYASTLSYLYFYIFMNLGAFACVILLSLKIGSDQINDYIGLLQKEPLLATGLSFCLISLAGIPPSAGFFGKMYLFTIGWKSGTYLAVVIGLLTSVISIGYYLRVVQLMIIDTSSSDQIVYKKQGSVPFNVGLATCLAGTLGSGILSNAWINSIQDIANSSF
uniref:NAD(P)H-quinone oxidoreductase subunit 2, chloroplastic n=1 Tax=Picocystis salinarum TaxID=88271 RepID=A0A088CK68_9CHLO|nr:subunit 2 of NADH-plastoquinone oxidoreductase [Picocystis salinarum]AID67594.1 subunit 2 of NADH-plastoquinone oxidoreductase [Picocystis salinarum]